MPVKDLPTPEKAYLRLIWKNTLENLVFSSHGIWRPGKEGMTRVNYTYHWYTQPNTVLSGSAYKSQLASMGAAAPVDSFGPGSGEVANMLLVPLEAGLFKWTNETFADEKIHGENPTNLSLLTFFKNTVGVQAMTLKMLDSQLLPWLKYPLGRPVHMVVCRSLEMNHVVPVVTHNVVVMASLPSPFDSITNDML